MFCCRKLNNCLCFIFQQDSNNFEIFFLVEHRKLLKLSFSGKEFHLDHFLFVLTNQKQTQILRRKEKKNSKLNFRGLPFTKKVKMLSNLQCASVLIFPYSLKHFIFFETTRANKLCLFLNHKGLHNFCLTKCHWKKYL